MRNAVAFALHFPLRDVPDRKEIAMRQIIAATLGFGIIVLGIPVVGQSADQCPRELSQDIGVFAALKEQLSGGEADDVLAQLPRDLKDVWEDA
jgi:hypothetical protein